MPLRLSVSLWNEIAQWAEDDFRSMNGQIEYLLTECVKYRPASGSGTNPPGHRRLGPPRQRRPRQRKRPLRASQKARNIRAFFFCAGKDTIPVKGNKTLLRGAPCKGRPRQTCCPQTAFVPRCSHGVSPFGKKRLTTGEKIVIILTLIN